MDNNILEFIVTLDKYLNANIYANSFTYNFIYFYLETDMRKEPPMSNNKSEDLNQKEVKIGKRTFWQAAVPLPLYTHSFFFRERFQCKCAKKFKTEKEYEHHYRKEHISEQ